MRGNKKRKRGREKRSIKPKNKYADNPPDFSLLASLYPSFSQFVYYSPDNNRPRIDWTDFNATRELTRILLLHDHSINWWIPDGQLCPTVPNRSNYIHWIEDLLASDLIEKNHADGDKVRGFDIGTGANCVYPLLGASLLGWSFVGSDVTDVALEWAEYNVKSNPHISELIEIRRVEVAGPANGGSVVELSGSRAEDDVQGTKEHPDLSISEVRELDENAVISFDNKVHSIEFNHKEFLESNQTREGAALSGSSNPAPEESNVDKGYHGPPILLGVVKEGEKFDFCMCNPPFFESMEEAGLNPKTSCGGTPAEMVCPGGERAFVSCIIEDSVILKQSFRWYTSMVGKKSNLKFLTSKLWEMGATIVKTTEFVQGQTCRWGLAWSFMPRSTKLMPSKLGESSNFSFMLEGIQRQFSAFNVLQSVESFFSPYTSSCKSNASSFTVDVSVSKDDCDAILKINVINLDESSRGMHVAEASPLESSLDKHMNLSFRISVFQQIPGTLLVKGSLQQRDSPLSSAFSSVFQQLEKFLKHKFCKEKVLVGPVHQVQRR